LKAILSAVITQRYGANEPMIADHVTKPSMKDQANPHHQIDVRKPLALTLSGLESKSVGCRPKLSILDR
jgi:hypothetical protein